MDGVAEGVEQGPDVEADLVGQGHHVEGRDAQIVGKGPLAVHADPLRVRVQVEPARPAGGGVQVDDVPLAGDPLAEGQGPVDPGADLDDLPGELVADDHRRRDRPRGPVVPLVDVDVGAADGRALHADQHIVRTRRRHRCRHLPEAGLRMQLGEAAHGPAHACPSSRSRTRVKAAMVRSIWSGVWAADSWVRMRACPLGTTGKEKPVT